MNWRNRLLQVGCILVGSLGLGASCGDEELPVIPLASGPIPPPKPQESIVVVEVDVPSVGWVAIPVPEEGMERLARTWCWAERKNSTDTTLCTTALGSIDPLEVWDPVPELGTATVAKCQDALCRQRNETCAGYLLEEVARSPLPRVLDATLYDPDITQFDLKTLLQVPDAALQHALAKGGAPTTTQTTDRIRFQPLEAPGKAAALRGALNRYREAALIGRDMQDPALTTPAANCPDLFAAGGTPITTLLTADGNGVQPTWLDVYYQSFLDSVQQYSGALPRAVSEMRSSAQLQVRGEDHELDALAIRICSSPTGLHAA